MDAVRVNVHCDFYAVVDHEGNAILGAQRLQLLRFLLKGVFIQILFPDLQKGRAVFQNAPADLR